MSDTRARPKQKLPVGAVADFPVGAFRLITVGEREIGVIRLPNGEIHAMRNRCPHKAAPICRGLVGGTALPSAPGQLIYGRDGEVVACPWHGFEYDIRSGEELYQAKPTRLRKYPVDIEDGQVVLTV